MKPKKKAYIAAANLVAGVSNLLQFKEMDKARKFVVAITNINTNLNNRKK